MNLYKATFYRNFKGTRREHFIVAESIETAATEAVNSIPAINREDWIVESLDLIAERDVTISPEVQ